MDRAALARMIDHTLLRPEATRAEVEELCREASEFGVIAVCVNPSMLPLDAGWLGEGILVASVVGFPFGTHEPHHKAAEAAAARAHGASEIDMVINIGLAKAGAWSDVEADIAAVRATVPAPAVLKVII